MPAARFVYGRPVEEMGCAAARDHRGDRSAAHFTSLDPLGLAVSAHTSCGTPWPPSLRGGADPVLVADLLGHADLGTLKIYTQPNDADRERALALLTTDA